MKTVPGSPENPDPEDPNEPEEPEESGSCPVNSDDTSDPLEDAPPGPDHTRSKSSTITALLPSSGTEILPPTHTITGDAPPPPAPTHVPNWDSYTISCYTSGHQVVLDDANSAIKEWCRRE